MARKKTPAIKYGEFMGELFEIFNRADGAKLEAAIKSQDYAKLSEVVGVPEKKLRSLQSRGRKLALDMFDAPLREAVAAFKKFIKNRQ